MEKGRCQGCGTNIVWIKTVAGKNMPCDPNPVPYWEKPKTSGKIVTSSGQTLSCELEGNLKDATGFGYISHFSTCPKAKVFKRKV